jgi:hypothetical protein
MSRSFTFMSTALAEYEKLSSAVSSDQRVTAGQMFGKACLKVDGKAFAAQHLETVVFKLGGPHHQQAMALPGAVLWDPSGKGRPMKEWVALPADVRKHFKVFCDAALAYVSAGK